MAFKDLHEGVLELFAEYSERREYGEEIELSRRYAEKLLAARDYYARNRAVRLKKIKEYKQSPQGKAALSAREKARRLEDPAWAQLKSSQSKAWWHKQDRAEMLAKAKAYRMSPQGRARAEARKARKQADPQWREKERARHRARWDKMPEQEKARRAEKQRIRRAVARKAELVSSSAFQ